MERLSDPELKKRVDALLLKRMRGFGQDRLKPEKVSACHCSGRPEAADLPKTPPDGKKSKLLDSSALGLTRLKLLRGVAIELQNPYSLEGVAELGQTLAFMEAVRKLPEPAKLESQTIADLNRLSQIALQTCAVLEELSPIYVREVLAYFRPLVVRLSNVCQEAEVQIFDPCLHWVDKGVGFPRVFLDHFERVQVRPLGHVWSAVSVSLFGDYGAAEALRLLTAAAFLRFEKQFRLRLGEQERQTGHAHVSFEGLLAGITELAATSGPNATSGVKATSDTSGSASLLDTTATKYQLLALSLAIRRPFYCYASFGQFDGIKLPPGSAHSPFDIAKLVYEQVDTIGHYRIVGFKEDEPKEPICIYFDGSAHYCAILPKFAKHSPLWKPKTLLFDYLVPKGSPSPSLVSSLDEWLPSVPSTSPDSESAKESSPESNLDSILESNTAASIAHAKSVTDDFAFFKMECQVSGIDQMHVTVRDRKDQSFYTYQVLPEPPGGDQVLPEPPGGNQVLPEPPGGKSRRKVSFDSKVVTEESDDSETTGSSIKCYNKAMAKCYKFWPMELRDSILGGADENLKFDKCMHLSGSEENLAPVKPLPRRQNSSGNSGKPKEFRYCYTCAGRTPSDDVEVLDCKHTFCKSCFRTYLEMRIVGSDSLDIHCPLSGCRMRISDKIIANALPRPSAPAYEETFSSLSHCPNCKSLCHQDAATYLGECGVCQFLFCIRCRKSYHGNQTAMTCDEVVEKEAKEEKILNCKVTKFESDKKGHVCKNCSEVAKHYREVKRSTK